MDTLQQMKIFCKVAEKHSFVEAARKLRISTAAVSKSVGALEERLATRLFNRTTRQVSITDAGRAYYDRCLAILADIDETEAELSQTVGAPKGKLRVGAPMSFGIMHLGDVIGKFLLKYPEISVDLAMGDRRLDPLEEGYDVTLRIATQLPESGLVATRITEIDRVLCASPEYLRRHGCPKTPKDLQDHNCLTYSLSERPGLWSFTRKKERTTVRVQGSFTSSNSIVIRDALLNGVGIALITTYIVEKELKSGKLVRILDKYETEGHTLSAIYPHRRYLSQKVRVFVDFLKEAFDEKLKAAKPL